MEKVQRYSRRFRYLFQTLLWLMPLLFVGFWFTYQTPYDFYSNTGMFIFDFQGLIQHPLSNTTRLLALAASMLPCAIIVYGLYYLRKLFFNYERGEVFSLNNAIYYRKLGYTLFYWALAGLLYEGMISVILSFNNPPGHRVLTLSFNGVDVLTLLCGAIVVLISWVMHEAHRLAIENQLTI